jgi:hypothetical protein
MVIAYRDKKVVGVFGVFVRRFRPITAIFMFEIICRQ